MKQISISIPTGEQLALWKITHENSQRNKHVFLTHGTFSSKKVCLVLAEYLAEKGYNCWILEWRNHGESFKTALPYNFDTIAKEDIKAVFDYLIEEQEVKQLDVVTHSGGGLCFTIALLHYPSYCTYINSITLFACQATKAASNWKKKLRLQMGKGACKLLGYVPANKIGGEYNEPYFFMKQWFDWNLKGMFIGSNQENYYQKMASIDIPVLAIFGKGDTFIAPAEGCKEFLGFFQNPQNASLYGAKDNGFLEDYTHSRIIHSSSAHKEIYPKVLGWMESKNPDYLVSSYTG